MPNNDEKIGQALEALQADVTTMKDDLTSLKQGQAEIKETMATKADIQDLKATVMKKVNDHEERITELEKEAGILHPHKH